jgi:HicB_like antitoxin of bacterial toxin-antitoxin system
MDKLHIMTTFYAVLIETTPEGQTVVVVPDLGMRAVGTTPAQALARVIGFSNAEVREMVERGYPVPPPRAIDTIPAIPHKPELARALIPVEVPGKSVKLSISIDEALLIRADRAAQDEGLTRSGYIAAAIVDRLRKQA